MSCDCENSDFIFGRAIIPEDSICRRGTLFSISHKHLLLFRALEAGELMCLEAVVAWVRG